ncbi:MAG TPA: hypothetical protein VIM16_18045 [Mucilaginibacter sp.]|jgi:hypothetical protein
MFKQFTENIKGDQVYLIASLGIFLIFFIVVTVLLIRLRKNHVEYMSDLPLEDSTLNSSKSLQL